jgi:hypothetical protein
MGNLDKLASRTNQQSKQNSQDLPTFEGPNELGLRCMIWCREALFKGYKIELSNVWFWNHFEEVVIL